MIHVYTTPNCFGCKKTKELLDAAGVQYLAIDLSEDKESRDFVVDGLGHKQAPVVVVFDEPDLTGPPEEWTVEVKTHWSGLNPRLIDQLIKEETE